MSTPVIHDNSAATADAARMPRATAIALLSAPGIVMGALTLTGAFGAPVEFTLWTLAALAFWLPMALRWTPDAPFVSLLAAGTLAGVWTGAIQGALAPTLLANNAGYAASFPEATTEARLVLFVSAVGIGLVWGALFGGIAWAVRRRQARRA